MKMTMVKRVLLVDDDQSLCQVMEHHFKKYGYEVIISHDGQDGLNKFKKGDISLVLTDLQLPLMNGLELLKEIKRLNPGVLVIVITAFGTIDTAVQSMKQGACDYLTKPISRDQLKIVLERAFKIESLTRENIYLREELIDKFSFPNIVGTSSKMTDVLRIVQRLSQSDVAVLIQGKSGTGKELIARAIHYNSKRREKNFIAVNCPSISEHLIESELFGHIKGSFTGAISDRQGKFELAHQGTIFLDEIGEMKLELQTKLLRVLQEKEIERIGDTKPIKIDIRLIVATNKNLEEELKRGNFREDLFYRINVAPILLPPLRERKEDIPILVKHFFHKFKSSHCQINPEVLELFQKYDWPGNVRELENIIERALALQTKKGVITIEDLPANLKTGAASTYNSSLTLPSGGMNLEEAEKRFIRQALERTNGNQTRAAELLGLTRSAFIYRMEKYGLQLDQ